MFKFEAFNILLKGLFEKIASVVKICNTPSSSACCVSSGNSISALYSWTQNLWFLGLPKAYRINTNVQGKIMLIMEIKFPAAIVHCPQMNIIFHIARFPLFFQADYIE